MFEASQVPRLNIFMHADDGLLHCVSLLQAEKTLSVLQARLKEIGLEIHPDRSHVIYCKHAKGHLKFTKTSLV